MILKKCKNIINDYKNFINDIYNFREVLIEISNNKTDNKQVINILRNLFLGLAIFVLSLFAISYGVIAVMLSTQSILSNMSLIDYFRLVMDTLSNSEVLTTMLFITLVMGGSLVFIRNLGKGILTFKNNVINTFLTNGYIFFVFRCFDIDIGMILTLMLMFSSINLFLAL